MTEIISTKLYPKYDENIYDKKSIGEVNKCVEIIPFVDLYIVYMGIIIVKLFR